MRSLPKRSAPASSTTAPGEGMVAAGLIQFVNAPMGNVLQVYADFIGSKMVRSPQSVGGMKFTLRTQTPLTREEVRYAFETVFAWNGLKIVRVSDREFAVDGGNER